MKGLHLPSNTVIILIVAVMVIIAMAGFFTMQSFGAISEAESKKHFALACNKLRYQYDCDLEQLKKVSIKSDGKEYYLYKLCMDRGLSHEGACAQLCGCRTQEQGSLLQNIEKPGNNVNGDTKNGDPVRNEPGELIIQEFLVD